MPGALPPPYHGGSVFTEHVLRSPLAEQFELLHLDTSDRRPLATIGRLDPTNIWLGARHAVEAVRLMRRERPDILYVSLSQNRLGFLRDACFLLPARWLGIPTVVHINGGHFGAFHRTTDRAMRRLVREVMGGVSRAVVVGERLRPMLDGLVPPERIVSVPNGIPDPAGNAGAVAAHPGAAADAAAGAAADAAKAGAGAGDGRQRVVFLSQLTETKGFVDFLEAARVVAARRPGVRFDLAGEFGSPADEAAAAAYGVGELADRVAFVGVVSGRTKAEFLARAELFVLPSYYPFEGHPHVVLEAMAAGLPVVATDHAAIPETVLDGVTGFIVPKRAPDALAERIERILSDATLRGRLGREGRARFEAEYTLERWAERMADVFDGALAEGGPA
jgi:glycosyltransferase involved in cell wall biosynthesis